MTFMVHIDLGNCHFVSWVHQNLRKTKVPSSCLGYIFWCKVSSFLGLISIVQASSQEYAFTSGLSYGQIIFSMANARAECYNAFQCGEELMKVEKRIKKYTKVFSDLKHQLFLQYISPVWQATLNLMGHSENPEQLTGEVMSQEKMINICLENKRERSLIEIYHICSWLAYLFGNYELASRMIENRKQFDLYLGPCFLLSNIWFFDGMVALAACHTLKTDKWMGVAQKSLVQMEKCASVCPLNYKHRFLLLQAELAFLLEENENAEVSYNDAIKTADENGFVQDQALAYERAGYFYMKQGKTSIASQNFGLSHNAYLDWGAQSKANQLRLFCPF